MKPRIIPGGGREGKGGAVRKKRVQREGDPTGLDLMQGKNA